MNGTELGALRRLLMFSAPEAARWIASDEQRPHGVEERTWNRWESGKLPVPDNVAKAVRVLVDWRDTELANLLAWVDFFSRARHLAGRPVRLLWYQEVDDFMGPPVLWRPQCSALSTVLALSRLGQTAAPVELVPFDAVAYRQWRQSHDQLDTAEVRLHWADALDRGHTPVRAKEGAPE